MAGLEHRQQGRCCDLLLLQPLVEGLFDCPGHFTQCGEADHAAAALEGMEAAPHRGQGFAVMRVGYELRQAGSDGRQDFARFLEEDGEQFGIQLGAAGLGQAGGFGRGGGKRGGALLQRGLDERRRLFAIDRLDGGARLLRELSIGDQVGVLAQGLEILLELLAQPDLILLRRGAEPGRKNLGLRERPAHLLLEARNSFLGRRSQRHGIEDGIDIGRAELQLLDKEAEARKFGGHFLEVGLLRYV